MVKTVKRYWEFFLSLAGIPWMYRKSLWYIIRKRGIRSAGNFLFIKYFVADEGGEEAVLNQLIAKTKRASLAPYPFKVEVEHSTICNKKCLMCEHTYWHETPDRLTFEQYRRIIDQFPGLKWSNVTGEGTGFMNPDFMKILEYLRSRDISVNFVDEFDFIDESKARKFIELGINCIWISMDGATKETYEKIKVGCNFEKALANIKTLLRLKKELKSPFPTICFRFVANNLNYKEMPKMVELVHSLGDRGERAKLEFTGLLAFKEIEYLSLSESPDEVIALTKDRAKQLGVPISFSHFKKEELPSITKCTAWLEPYIMMGGYVLPCCAILMSNKRDFLRKYALGNINDKSFREIWYSDRYKKFRKLVVTPDGKVPILCAGCRGYNTRDREKQYGVTTEV
ncbi:MAG: radical SAM protein [bacterium]|nr:radical SAM protein [bacterium]